MTLDASRSPDAFRARVRDWLAEHVVGEFAALRGRGGPGDEDVGFDIRVAWEQQLGEPAGSGSVGRASSVAAARRSRSR